MIFYFNLKKIFYQKLILNYDYFFFKVSIIFIIKKQIKIEKKMYCQYFLYLI